ncbi:MAG: sialidase family protein, partial [Bacteroidota bacterium]
DGWEAPRNIVSGKDWFVNWADFPGLVAQDRGRLMAWWLQKSGEGTYAYDVMLTFSQDNGAHWSPPVKAHQDSTQAEHGFVSAIPLPDGNFQIAWLDGRQMAASTPRHDHHNDGHGGPMSLRSAVFSPNGQRRSSGPADLRVCDCCQTSMALATSGPALVYRDRSETEVRDISIVRRTDTGWTAPQPVHEDGWQIDGCPVNGPQVVAMGDTLAVTWFTMASGTPTVNVAFSYDGGATFTDPVRVGSDSTLGRLALAPGAASGKVWLAWMALEKEVGVLYVQGVQADGPVGEAQKLGEVAGDRSSGFPRMVHDGQSLIIAWTAGERNDQQVLVKRIPL